MAASRLPGHPCHRAWHLSSLGLRHCLCTVPMGFAPGVTCLLSMLPCLLTMLPWLCCPPCCGPRRAQEQTAAKSRPASGQRPAITETQPFHFRMDERAAMRGSQEKAQQAREQGDDARRLKPGSLKRSILDGPVSGSSSSSVAAAIQAHGSFAFLVHSCDGVCAPPQLTTCVLCFCMRPCFWAADIPAAQGAAAAHRAQIALPAHQAPAPRGGWDGMQGPGEAGHRLYVQCMPQVLQGGHRHPSHAHGLRMRLPDAQQRHLPWSLEARTLTARRYWLTPTGAQA